MRRRTVTFAPAAGDDLAVGGGLVTILRIFYGGRNWEDDFR